MLKKYLMLIQLHTVTHTFQGLNLLMYKNVVDIFEVLQSRGTSEVSSLGSWHPLKLGLSWGGKTISKGERKESKGHENYVIPHNKRKGKTMLSSNNQKFLFCVCAVQRATCIPYTNRKLYITLYVQ